MRDHRDPVHDDENSVESAIRYPDGPPPNHHLFQLGFGDCAELLEFGRELDDLDEVVLLERVVRGSEGLEKGACCIDGGVVM